ncbi:hypothetical protein [Streptomyces sp. NPDC052042]|uniref:hypothetical protein n=1 Tax=Streptomyces sp. NPDC052042 TaxID=3365683 RepID=UPI0037D669D7
MSPSATRVGLCSGSAPGLSADALATLTRSLGGSTVDVRVGKGHAWETTGGLAALRAAGCAVAFVGVGTVLGDPAHPAGVHDGPSRPEPGLPVKVFAAEGCTAPERIDLTLAQVRALADLVGGPHLVLAETHHGYAPVEELAALCTRAGTGIVLDTLGLARITDDPVRAVGRLARWISYAQVKGFDPDDPHTSPHLPLGSSCADLTHRLLTTAGPLKAVTVESKAGSLAEDTALLLQWYASTPRSAEEAPA